MFAINLRRWKISTRNIISGNTQVIIVAQSGGDMRIFISPLQLNYDDNNYCIGQVGYSLFIIAPLVYLNAHICTLQDDSAATL